MMHRISWITLLCLGIVGLPCLGWGNGNLTAFAAEKSAISPEINTPAVTAPETASPAIAPDVAPSLPPESPTVSITSNSSSNNLENSFGNTATSDRQPTENPSVIVTSKERLDRPEIILESRSTGCITQANAATPSLCPSQPTAANGNGSGSSANVVYNGNVGAANIQIRQLSREEVAALNQAALQLPRNGDKQMLFPLALPAVISSVFGSRVHPVTGQIRFHQGTDLAAAAGTPVVAAFSGRVEVAGWMGGYGLMVVLSHGSDTETRYAHLSEILVQDGQEVKQGTVIGLVGSTGLSTGPHLHFELWRKLADGWTALDPTPQLVIALEQIEQYFAQKDAAKPRA
jgi:murein DD-endopeptidase MepM/ murein hydrolase activator NlpD